MKITVSIDNLRAAIEAARPVAAHRPPAAAPAPWSTAKPKRPKAPDLVTLDARDGALHVVATDADLTIATEVRCEVAEPGAVVARATRVVELLDVLAGGTVTLAGGNTNHLEFAADGVTGSVAALAVSVDPAKQMAEPTFTIVDAKLLCDVLDATAPTASADDTRRHLCGVRFEQGDGAITAVATDGCRLVYTERAGSLFPTGATPTLHRRGLKELRLLAHGRETIALALTDRCAIARAGGVTITIARCDAVDVGRFPEWRPVTRPSPNPRGPRSTITVHRDTLIAACKRSALIARRGTSGLIIVATEADGLFLATHDIVEGDARERVGATLRGPAKAFAVDPGYLADALATVDGEMAVLDVGDYDLALNALDSMRVHRVSDESTVAIVMPMRCNESELAEARKAA